MNRAGKRESRSFEVLMSFIRSGLVWVVVTGTVFLAGQAWGQTSSPRNLTLQQALDIAAEQNRDILKAKEYRNQVLGRYREERAAVLPQFSLNASDSASFDNTFGALFGGEFAIPSRQNVRSAGVSVSQVIFTWGKVGAAIRAAKFGLSVASDQLRLYRQAAARDVSTEFYNVLLAKQLSAISVENLKQRERHLEEARRKYAVGMATDYDVLAGEVALKNAQPSVIRSENLIRIARERLRFLLAIGEEEVDAEGSLGTEINPYPQFEEALTTAWDNRPEIADLEHRLGIYRELVKVASAGDKPRVDFNGTAGLRNFGVGPFSASGETWSAAVTLSFPFFDGQKTRGQVQQAQSEVVSRQIELAKLKDSVAVQVREAVNAVRENGEIVKGLTSTVSEAERLRWMAEKGFELGAKTRLEVDDAQGNVIQAKGNLAVGLHGYLVARVSLEWAKGTIQ